MKRTDENTRRKRETLVNVTENAAVYDKNDTIDNTSLANKHSYNTTVFIVKNSLELFVSKLHHFTEYEVSIQACREKTKGNNRPECSVAFNKLWKTSKKGD